MNTQLSAVQTAAPSLEQVLFFTLLQLVVILFVASAAGTVRHKLGQPQVVAEIAGGLVLGPSLLGYFAPGLLNAVFYSTSSVPIHIIGQIGLLLLTFQIGMDFNFSYLRFSANRRAAILISAGGILLPFAFGFALGRVSVSFLAPRVDPLLFSLFLATALSITALPVIGRIMAELDLTRSIVGVISITAAVIDDMAGWLLLAVISALSTARHLSFGGFFAILFWLVLYAAICWCCVRPFLRWLFTRFRVTEQSLPQPVFTTVLILIFISGVCTHMIGFFTVFGGFMLGVLVHDRREFVEVWKKKVGNFVLVFFMPIFFTFTGLHTNVPALNTVSLWIWCIIVVFIATAGKFGGAYLAARMTGFPGGQAAVIGAMMNTRGLMELIVLNVGRELGIVPQNVFTILVLMAIFSTVAATPVVRFLLKKSGHEGSEAAHARQNREGLVR